MKRAILVGAGAEIGSNLLLLNTPEKDGFVITKVLTNAPPLHKNYPYLRPIDGIVARLALAQPGAHALVKVIDDQTLRIGTREIHFEFCDLRKEFPKISNSFDLAFLATSKTDISAESSVVSWLKGNCRTILGVAEANDLPSIYDCLTDLSTSDLPTAKSQTINEGVYCLGSCQTNGMQASLRVIIEALRALDLSAKKFSRWKRTSYILTRPTVSWVLAPSRGAIRMHGTIYDPAFHKLRKASRRSCRGHLL